MVVVTGTMFLAELGPESTLKHSFAFAVPGRADDFDGFAAKYPSS